jgi:hypothetical protein
LPGEKQKIILGGVFNQQQIFWAAADSATPLPGTVGGSGIKPTPSGHPAEAIKPNAGVG